MQSLVRSEKYSDLDLPVGEALKSRPEVCKKFDVGLFKANIFIKTELSRCFYMYNE
jgi:hypothetical protein